MSSQTLNSGHPMPQIGFGTWQAAPGEVGNAVRAAVEAGYRHLDYAKVYENQVECGQGFKEGLANLNAAGTAVTRVDFFLTSKLWNSSHAPNLGTSIPPLPFLMIATVQDDYSNFSLSKLDVTRIYKLIQRVIQSRLPWMTLSRS